MARKLDRYVGRMLLGSYAASFLLLVFLFMVVDLVLEGPEYLAAARKADMSLPRFFWEWLRFHLLFTPFEFVIVAPFATVISCMFAVVRLMSQNEVMPMLFTGRSVFRVLRPALLLGVLSGLAMAACWQFVIPGLADETHALQARLKDQQAGPQRQLVLRVPPRQDVVATRYWHERQYMEGVFLLDRGSRPDDMLLVEADAAHWNPETQDWELVGGIERRGGVVTPRATLGVSDLTPEKIWKAGREERRVAAEYSYSDLVELHELQPARRDYLIALHQHVTFPLANLVLLLLALPFAVSFERGSKVGRVILAIVFCGFYLIIDLTCQNLGQKAWLHPVVAAWVPTILFGSLGVVIFGGMRT